ncbi:hypothetical protein [Streptomyces sp. NPDC059552]|uniref:hypothetical protein n=1 Tax=Streptomyces sp. NPDC059552 TaxID=3346862 RepID=UPI00368AC072
MTSKPSTPDSDGPKTETTLTTRIRINIPGSRPIPPVVVRKAMGTNSGPAGAGEQTAPEPAAEPPLAQRRGPQPTRIEAAPEPDHARPPAPAPAERLPRTPTNVGVAVAGSPCPAVRGRALRALTGGFRGTMRDSRAHRAARGGRWRAASGRRCRKERRR